MPFLTPLSLWVLRSEIFLVQHGTQHTNAHVHTCTLVRAGPYAHGVREHCDLAAQALCTPWARAKQRRGLALSTCGSSTGSARWSTAQSARPSRRSASATAVRRAGSSPTASRRNRRRGSGSGGQASTSSPLPLRLHSRDASGSFIPQNCSLNPRGFVF